MNDLRIQKTKINARNIERYNGNEVITENEVNTNKQETNIIEESLIINVIIEPFIKINEIKISDEPKVNNIIIKNNENTNKINEICKNNREIENIMETNSTDFIESTVKNYEANDEMNFNKANIKTHEDDDKINLIDFHESDINNQKNENINEINSS